MLFFPREKKALNFPVTGEEKIGSGAEHKSPLLCVILRWDQFADSPTECTTC